MDLETAAPAADSPATDGRMLRRGLLAVGLAGVASVVASASTASAAPPKRPTDGDVAALRSAMELELTASALYGLAAAQIGDDEGEFIGVVGVNHRAYGESIAGMIGASAQGRNEEVYDALEARFDTSDVQVFAAAARDLENTAVATHTELLGRYEGVDAVGLTASILVVEARHAAVFTSMAGFIADLDDMLSPTASAIELGGVA